MRHKKLIELVTGLVVLVADVGLWYGLWLMIGNPSLRHRLALPFGIVGLAFGVALLRWWRFLPRRP